MSFQSVSDKHGYGNDSQLEDYLSYLRRSTEH